MGRLINADIVTTKFKTLEDYYEAQFKVATGSVVYNASMCGRLFGLTEAKCIVENTPTVETCTKAEVVELLKAIREQIRTEAIAHDGTGDALIQAYTNGIYKAIAILNKSMEIGGRDDGSN